MQLALVPESCFNGPPHSSCSGEQGPHRPAAREVWRGRPWQTRLVQPVAPPEWSPLARQLAVPGEEQLCPHARCAPIPLITWELLPLGSAGVRGCLEELLRFCFQTLILAQSAGQLSSALGPARHQQAQGNVQCALNYIEGRTNELVLSTPTQQKSGIKGGKTTFEDRREMATTTPGGLFCANTALRLRAKGRPWPSSPWGTLGQVPAPSGARCAQVTAAAGSAPPPPAVPPQAGVSSQRPQVQPGTLRNPEAWPLWPSSWPLRPGVCVA